jgi:hypothetical protein
MKTSEIAKPAGSPKGASGAKVPGTKTSSSKRSPSHQPKAASAKHPRNRDRSAGSNARTLREGTKLALLVEMLRRPKGVTINELADAIGWQPHSVRGAMSGALKKKLGLTIESLKIEGRGHVYRTAS